MTRQYRIIAGQVETVVADLETAFDTIRNWLVEGAAQVALHVEEKRDDDPRATDRL